MAADKTIKALLDTMDKAIADFQQGLPGIQEGLVSSLMDELKGLQTKGGTVLNSVQNLKLILNLKNKIQQLIIGEGYKDSVSQFLDAFDVVAGLHIQYFQQFNEKFKPSKTLPIIKELAVDQTVNDLMGQGLQSNIVDEVTDLLKQNIGTGGSYASLTKQLQDQISGTPDNEGLLQKYAKTITTDAINQYSAQYHEAIAADLNLNWGRYIGSLLTTSREFCEYLTKKEWVHKSELPTIVKGEIDGHQCKLSRSTGLPLGMIPGTDASNFKIRRGGYNCGHQFFWVPDSAVPDQVKSRISSSS